MSNETFKERQARGFRAQAGAVTENQEFLAINAGKKRVSQNPVDGESGGLTGAQGLPGGIVTHTRPGLVTMWKPDASKLHWTPRSVPASSIANNLLNGWAVHCPECGGDHGSDPNECTGRPPTMKRICPVCGQPIYDALGYTAYRGADDDPNVIHDETDFESTPASRTLVARNLHMWVRHPQESREMGLPALTNPPDVVTDSVGT